MMTRVAAGLLALTVLFASGFTGGIAYLCFFDGSAGTTCCCPHAGDELDCGQSQVERTDCCEVQVAHAGHPPATAEIIRRGSLPPPVLLATLPHPVGPLAPATHEAAFPPGARGPPPAGPPLFLWNCRYLI